MKHAISWIIPPPIAHKLCPLRTLFLTSFLIISIIFSSILFSSFHYIGVESFTPLSFTLRFIAGVYLSLIYINRGFGIVALTHAFYDLFVIFQLT